VLRVTSGNTTYALFLGIDGEGDDRRAVFAQFDCGGNTFGWSAYRYNGGWAYGSSAERLSLVAVLTDPAVTR
jgi:hypothetical protein